MNKTFLPTAASFLISENCNLNCSYCFEKKKYKVNMSKDTAIKAVEMLFDNLNTNHINSHFQKNDKVGITLFGGEPLLNFETIKALMLRSDELKKETGYDYEVMTITNGTIITQEMIDFFKNYDNFIIQLSIDGLQEGHDFYRKYYSGKGSFNDIIKNIPKFKEIFGGEKFYKKERSRYKLNIHGSLNKMTIKTMYDSWKYFTEELDIPQVWFMPIHDEQWDEQDVIIYEEQLTKIATAVIKKSLNEGTKNYIDDYSPLNKCIYDEKLSFSKPCGAGDSYISFSANGDIYPCHQFYFIDKETTKIGENFKIDENKRSMFLFYNENDMNCSKKNCKNYDCYRCIAENYTTNGTILNCEIGIRCKMSNIENRIIKNMRKIVESNL